MDLVDKTGVRSESAVVHTDCQTALTVFDASFYVRVSGMDEPA
jgi:hypothetical protein